MYFSPAPYGAGLYDYMANEESSELKQAKTVVYRFLSYRFRSEQEVLKKLEEREFLKSVRSEAVNYFKKHGLIDDVKFAQQFSESRQRKGFGKRRILIELKDKGVDKAILQNLTIFSEEVEKATAKELAGKRSLKYKGLEKEKIKQRTYGYLIRRGFSPQDAYKAIQSL